MYFFEHSKDSKESKDLSQNAKLRFKIVLHKLSEPMSLIAMARAWDSFARAVVFEYAQRIGGECFSWLVQDMVHGITALLVDLCCQLDIQNVESLYRTLYEKSKLLYMGLYGSLVFPFRLRC